MKQYGEIMVDHRASPGIPEHMARRLGYEPEQVREGGLFEAATMTCAHCGRVVVKNPLRERERAICFRCNSYICDLCEQSSRAPDYKHLPRIAVVDLIQSGRVMVAGTDVNPLLIPKEG